MPAYNKQQHVLNMKISEHIITNSLTLVNI